MPTQSRTDRSRFESEPSLSPYQPRYRFIFFEFQWKSLTVLHLFEPLKESGLLSCHRGHYSIGSHPNDEDAPLA